MATIFPTSPAPQVNDEYQGYRYNGTSWDIIGVDLTGDYQTKVASVSNTELGYLDGVTSSVQTQLNAKQSTLSVGSGLTLSSSTVSVNPGAMLNQIVDGTSGNSYGIVGTSAYLDVKDTNGYNKEIELDMSAVQSQLVTDGFAKLAAPTFTGTVVLPSTTSIGNVTSTELGYLDGVTSAVQTQLNAKAPTADPTITGTMSAGIINTTGDISGGGWVGGVTSDGAGRGLLVRQAAGDANNAIIQFTNNGVTAQRASITAGAGGQLSMNSTTAFWGCIQTNTVAGQAVVVTSDGQLRRTSSSEKYKNSIEDLDHDVADRVLNLRPVWFKANETNIDNPEEWSYVGLIAEEVAEVEPRLALFKKAEIVYDELGNQKFNEDGTPEMTELDTPEPEGVKYAELSVYLLDIIKREKIRSSNLEQRIIDLEERLNNGI
jgi:hypothetical protein